MKNLIETLKEQTQSLKVQYIEKSKQWAEKDHNYHVQRCHWSVVDWCNFLNINHDNYKFPKGFWNTKESKTYDNASTQSNRIVYRLGKQGHIDQIAKQAEQHYENSIIKLAERIEKKQLNQVDCSVVTSHVGVNIETTLTDGIKTVHAWTIIAEGPIQRPHYRYLIK